MRRVNMGFVMADYPERSSHFAHKLTRLMLHSCAAQDIGADGVLLVLCIAHCEDAKRYTGAVTYWNEQLMPILGFSSWGQLDRARKRAVAAGWLHYECGGKRAVGRYWATIPPEVCGMEDDPNPEADYHAIVSKNGDKTEIEPRKNSRQSGDPSSLLLPSSTGTGAETAPTEVETTDSKKPKRINAVDGSNCQPQLKQVLAELRIKPKKTSDGSLKGIPDEISPAAVAAWWRGHLARDPLTGDTALDLLHVLCSAAFVRKSGTKVANRAASLAKLIANGKWTTTTTDLEVCYHWIREHIGEWILKPKQESVA